MKVIQITCHWCSNQKDIPKKEYDRWRRKGRERFYCSRLCAVAYGNSIMPNTSKARNPWNKGLKYTNQFREYIRRARNRKHYMFDERLTVEYLKRLWDDQMGLCALTGIPLVHGINAADGASLDRIECGKGYEVGNVRFVTMMTNWARNNRSDEEFRRYLDLIAQHRLHTSVAV